VALGVTFAAETLALQRTRAPLTPASDSCLRQGRPEQQLGLARQTILNQVRAGRRNAVHVVEGKRRGLRIEIRPGEQGLLELTSSPDL